MRYNQIVRPNEGGGGGGRKKRESEGTFPVLPRSSVQGGLDVNQKEAWSFYRAISGVRLCWELENPQEQGGCGKNEGGRREFFWVHRIQKSGELRFRGGI